MYRDRKEQLRRLESEEFDLLIIGGGATGCGIAFDAALRGYHVGLIEQGDFASGTSGRSTKLIHGGLRYLEQAVTKFDFSKLQLVKEALAERKRVLNIAPHLAHPLAIIIPFYKFYEKFYYGLGIKNYERLAGNRSVGKSRFLSSKEVISYLPHIRAEGLRGGILYYDGQFNDARYNVSLALSAIDHGAAVCNYLRFTDFEKEQGKITGVKVQEKFSGNQFSISTKNVINATGPFSDTIRLKDDPKKSPLIRTSSGTHILLKQMYTPNKGGLLIPKTEDGRLLFLLPWEGGTLVGTTDEPTTITDHPEPTKGEIDYLLHHLNTYLSSTVKEKDILASWSGIRPLIHKSNSPFTKELSRDYTIEKSPSGLYSIYGGKWTLYRIMAEKLLNQLVKDNRLFFREDCHTASTKIIGGDYKADELMKNLTKHFGIDQDCAEHLIHSYGGMALKIAQIAIDGYHRRLVEGYPYIEAEVIYCLEHELTCSDEDFLFRRLSLGRLNKKVADQAKKRVIELMDEKR